MSTPGHATYGKHMKRHELKEYLKPDARITNAILGWLDAEGVPKNNIEDEGDWIKFVAPVSQAEQMLNTDFAIYQHSASQTHAIRTLQYSVPASIAAHVRMIQPTTKFGQMRAQADFVFSAEDADIPVPTAPGYNATFCNTTITPDCLRGLYSLGDFRASADAGTKLGISGYLEQYAQYDLLAQFLSEYAPYANGDNFSVVSINGGLNTQNTMLDTAEANLDIQYGVSLSYDIPVTYYSTAGRGVLVPDLDQPNISANSNEPYLDQLHYLLSLSDEDLPTVLSTSYGEDEQSVPESYTNTTCQLFAQLGARGVSVIFSSGDTGVGSACQTNDGKNTTRFLPIFPAACPFVTSVGGTVHVEPEQAIYFSSGGFSDRFPRPSYQDKAVRTYLSILGNTWDGLYNPAGRGFPDVAAQGRNFTIYDQGRKRLIGGTSASAPTFAAIMADLNNVRQEKGKSPLGFLNPWLYSSGYKGLTDIVNGGSTGCTGKDIYSGLPTPLVPYASWNATKGWDPVTGLGTPIFLKLVDLSCEL